MPETPPPWIDRGDGFNLEFGEDEERPLRWMNNMASPGNNVIVDQYECTKNKQRVAIKSMKTFSTPATINTLNKEVRILRRLKHYHSIRALGSYTHQDRLYIITQPAALCDLREYLVEDNSTKTQKLIKSYGPRSDFLPRLMGCLAHGLQYIHGRKGATSTSGAQYASPERVDGTHRNISCDIFSLGCVFAEIFTVMKGKSAKAFLGYRKEEDPEGNGCFHKTVPQVLVWLDGLANERCDVQIVRLIRGMMRIESKDRPNAKQVWEILTTCTSDSGLYFCGPCCMPLHRDDPLLRVDADTDPSQTDYATSESPQNTRSLPNDLAFKEKYGAGRGPRLKWVRNLRHWEHATLDVVKSESAHSHARKRIFLPGNAHGADRAKNEAAILRKVKHRHIVTIRSTYEHPEIMTLHFEPAADYDLRSFLGLIELRVMRNRVLPKDFQLQKDLELLTESFGCLSGALAEIHEHGYDHGEIRPENILVHDNRIFISKFSFGLKCGGSATRSSSDNFLHRFINAFGALDFGSRGSQSARDMPQLPLSPGVVRDNSLLKPSLLLHVPADHLNRAYIKPPEWNPEPSDVGQPAADVFSLGCVFLEIYRVLTGGRVRDFEEQRANAGKSAYRDTLPKIQELVSSFEEDKYETKDRFLGMVLSMLDREPEKRPTAKAVYHTMVDCKTPKGHRRCGSCAPPGQE